MSTIYKLAGVKLYRGDCREVLRGMKANSIDTVICDPPYGLGFMGKDWDSPGGVGNFPMRRNHAANMVNTGASRQGGRQRGCIDWAKRQAREMRSYQEWCTEWAESLWRVCKPGAILLAFGGTRTFHRLACAIEDAGWEIRDCMMWLYGSGFPKSLDISKAIDKAAGVVREDKFEGAFDRRCGPTGNKRCPKCRKWLVSGSACECPRPQDAPVSNAAKLWNGWGTALKPAWEPIIVAMKPLNGTFAQNAQEHGVAGLNIDGGRIPLNGDYKCGANGRPSQTGLGDHYDPRKANVHSAVGRFPANLLLDKEASLMLDEQTGPQKSGGTPPRRFAEKTKNAFGLFNGHENPRGIGSSSGAVSRFFYCAKASKSERGDGNTHPTVKPLALMRYLCRLTKTPAGGTVLDCFMGSGTTAIAARAEGRKFIGIENNADYLKIARRRIAAGV